MSRSPNLRKLDHVCRERRISFDDVLGRGSLGFHDGDQPHGNTCAFEHRFTAEHTFGPMNEILSFAKSIGTGRELFLCARDVDNQIVVCPDRLGARIFIDGVEEAFSARPKGSTRRRTKASDEADRYQ